MNGNDLRAYALFAWIMTAPDLPAERGRGAGAEERSVSTAPTPRPFLPPMSVLVAIVAAMGIGLWAFAVVGAATVIHAVFG